MSENLSKWIEKNVLSQTYKRKNLTEFRKALNYLELKKPKEIILIGGTNGKGSLVELITQLSIKNKISVGTFSSPHLLNFNERIRIDGEEINDTSFLNALKKAKRISKNLNFNFYQIISLAALDHFNNFDLDLWVLEIGMGGRLDPMNSLNPDLSVITKVALDHQEFLGDTIEKIAEEKVAIARKEKPLIFGSSNIPNTVQKKTSKIKAKLISPKHNKKSKEFSKLLNSLSDKNILSKEVLFCADQILQYSNFNFSNKLTKNFLEKFKFFGRLTHFNNILLDSAHNEDAIKNLMKYLEKNHRKKKLNLFFCCSINKDPYSLLKPFEDKIDRIYLPDNIHDKLMSPKEVMSKAKDLNIEYVIKNSIEEVYSKTKNVQPNILNLIIGSFYFSGEFLKYFLEEKKLQISIKSLKKLI